jgi:uncharacterized protein (TIGR03790 family)
MKRIALMLALLMIVPIFPVVFGEDACSSSPREAPAPTLPANDYSDVLLLINNQSAISVQVGNYFKQKRSIPDGNVCNISMPTTEVISQAQFWTVRSSVEAFINASGRNDTFNYTVTTKGVPLRVSNSGGFTPSFDDELSLILGPYAGNINVNGAITNPYYGSQQRFSRRTIGVFITTRLSGYDINDCLRLVDNALNSTGARGKFVLDSQPWKDGGGYQSGNDWCRQANQTLSKRGWQVLLDDTPYYVVNQKNVSGYCSWGSNDGNASNNAKTNFTWVPGALGSTYVSTSARSFNFPPSYGQSLIADNIREGITGIHGNVDEPYLTACARPQIFLDRYTRGWNLAESLSASMATASWQNCIIGDPKIEPYANQPDPAVVAPDITLSPNLIVEGMSVELAAKVKNPGGGPAENTTVAFYDGDPAAGGRLIGANRTIPLLAPGSGLAVQATWNTTGLPGQHNIYVAISPSNITPQLWEGNDKAFVTTTVHQRPELVVPPEKFTVSDRAPMEGDTITFNFNIKNTGGYPAPTSVELFIDGASVQTKGINLQGGTEQNDRFSWMTAGRPGAHFAKIAAAPVEYELNSSNNNATAELFVRQYGLAMRPDAQERSCLPGLAASFNITVNSSANSPESVSISLSTPPLYWSADVEPVTAVIQPGSSSTHRVLVFSPSLASVSDRCTITVTCAGATSKISLETVLNVTIAPVRRLKLSCDPPEGTAMPGENATFKLDVRNLGNGPDAANISFDAPPGWNVEMETGRLDVPYQGFSSLVVKVSPSMSILAKKTGRVTITAISGDGNGHSTTIDVEAEQYFGVEASLLPGSISMRPGEQTEVAISIRNTGNGAEVFSVALPRTELELEVPSLSVSLDPFSQQNMTFSVKVPPAYKLSRENVQVGVESPGAGRVNVQLDVKLTRPDLSAPAQAVTLSPAAPVDGDTVIVTATIRNSGTAASGPVTVSLSESGRLLHVRTVQELAPGENISVTLTWNATAGSHSLVLSAVCGYIDPTPAGSSATLSVTVAPKPVRPSTISVRTGLSAAALASIVAAVALIIAAAVVVRKIGRKSV